MALVPNNIVAPWKWENSVKRKERELADWRGLVGKVKPLVESGQTDAARKVVADARPPEPPKPSPQMQAVSERLKSALAEMQSKPKATGLRASGTADDGGFRSAVQSGIAKVGRGASIAGSEIARGARANVGNITDAATAAPDAARRGAMNSPVGGLITSAPAVGGMALDQVARVADIPGVKPAVGGIAQGVAAAAGAVQRGAARNPLIAGPVALANKANADAPGAAEYRRRINANQPDENPSLLKTGSNIGLATVSGERFVNAVAGSNVTQQLPTPARYAIESFAAPVNLASVGQAGVAANAGGAGLKGVGAAVARRFALEGTSDLAGRIAGEQATKALPEDTPMPLKVGAALGAGILAGGATWKAGEKLLDTAPGVARGMKAGVDAQGGLASEAGDLSIGKPSAFDANPVEGITKANESFGGYVWGENFDDEQLQNVMNYSSTEYHDVNDYLRGLNPSPSDEARQIIKALDDVAYEMPDLTEDLRVYRWSGEDTALRPGDVFTEKAFTSTTLSEGYAYEWRARQQDKFLDLGQAPSGDVIYDITLPKGSPGVIPLYQLNREEFEVLLDRGWNFRVTGRTQGTSGETIIRAVLGTDSPGELGYIRPQLATTAAGAAAGGLYGATNPDKGPYGDRVSSALLYAGLGALAGAVAGKGIDLYARRGQGYTPPITTPSGATMVIDDVGTGGIVEAIATKAAVDRGPGNLASKYAPVRKAKGLLAPAAGMDAEVLYPLRASQGVRAKLQTSFQSTMKPVLDQLDAVAKDNPARYLGDVTKLSDAQRRLIGTLPDIMERPSMYDIAPALRKAIDDFAVTQWNSVSNVARGKYAVDVLPYSAGHEPGYAFVPHMTAADVSDDALAAASRGASFSAGRGTKERAYATLFERVSKHPDWQPELDMGTLTQRHLTGMALNAQDQTFKIGTGGLKKVEVLDITHPGLAAAKDDAVKEAASLRARVNTAIKQAGGLGDEIDELDKTLAQFDRGMPQGGMRPLAKTGTALKQSEGLVAGKRAETTARQMTGAGPVRVKVPPTGEALLQADAMDRVVNKFKPLIPDDVSEVAKLDTAMRRTEKRIQLLTDRKDIKVQGLAQLQSDLAKAKDNLDTLRQRYRTAGIPEDQYVQSTATHLYHAPEVAQSIDRLRAPVSGPLKGISEVVDEIRAWHLAGDGSPLTIQGQLAVVSDPVNAKHAVNWLFGNGNDPSNELARIAHTEADDVAQYTMATGRPFGQQTLELSVQQGKRGMARIPGASAIENKMFAAVEIGQFRGWQRDRDMLMKMHPGMTADVAANESARAWEKIIPSLSSAERGVSPGRAAVERIALTSASFAASPALLVKDATSGWVRLIAAAAQTHDLGLAVRTIPGRELIAMKRTLLMAGTLTTVAAATASLSAQSRGLSQEEAIKRAVLPWGGTGASPSGDWMTLQLGEGRRIGLGGPIRGFLKALAPDKDGVPLAGVEQWAKGKINQPIGAILDLKGNTDWRGNKIATADNRFGRLLQQAAYALESIAPITLGEAMSQARTGTLGWSNTLTGISAQEAGVNYVPPSPSERLHQVARQTYGKEFWDLSPSQKDAIKKDNPSLWLNYVAGASDMVRAAEQAKQDFLTQQSAADADLLAGKIALQDWASGLSARRNQLIGADRVIYADLDKGGKRNPILDSYYAAIDAANVNGSVDWTKVDAYVAGLSRADQTYIQENTGLTQTPLTRLRKTLQNDYYSLPRYRGYTAAEAGQIDDYYDDILNVVGSGASKSRKLAAAKQVAGTGVDPKVLKGLRMKILGYLDDTTDRQRWRQLHPESALIVSRGRMSAGQIAAIKASV